jgi:hypothetical protein
MFFVLDIEGEIGRWWVVPMASYMQFPKVGLRDPITHLHLGTRFLLTEIPFWVLTEMNWVHFI